MVLAAVMGLTLFAGCEKSEGSGRNLPDIGWDEVVMTIDGYYVTWEEYYYWLNYTYDAVLENLGDEFSWSAYLDNRSADRYILNQSTNFARLYACVKEQCNEYGVELTDEDYAELESNLQNMIELKGGEEEWAKYLEETCQDQELYDYMSQISKLYDKLCIEVYGENGEKCSDEEAIEWGNENGYYRAKQLVLKKEDANGEEYSEEELQKRKEQMEEFHTQLDESDDPIALFDELIAEYGEDAGMDVYPDGYHFITGVMNELFYLTTTNTEINDYSEVLDLDYGYVILLRLPLMPDAKISLDFYENTIRQEAALDLFDDWMLQKRNETFVVYNDEVYDQIDVKDIFG